MRSQTWCFVCVESEGGCSEKRIEKMLVNDSGLLQVRAWRIFSFTIVEDASLTFYLKDTLSFSVLSTTYVPQLEIKADPASEHVAPQSRVQPDK